MSKPFSRCRLGAALALIEIPFAGAAEQVDLLALAMDVSRSVEQSKFLLQREGYNGRVLQSPGGQCDQIRPAPEDCGLLHRLVRARPATARDRLECRRRHRRRAPLRRPHPQSPETVQRSTEDIGSFGPFGRVIARKLIAEIAMRPTQLHKASADP